MLLVVVSVCCVSDNPRTGAFFEHSINIWLSDIQRQSIMVIVHVHVPAQLKLFEIVDARNALRFGLRLGQSGQKQARQDRDDGDDNEEFNQRKPIPFCSVLSRSVHKVA